MRIRAIGLLLAATLAGCGGGAAPELADGAVRLVKVGSFDSPLYVTAPPGDSRRVFVVEQGGTVRVLRDGHRLSSISELEPLLSRLDES